MLLVCSMCVYVCVGRKIKTRKDKLKPVFKMYCFQGLGKQRAEM